MRATEDRPYKKKRRTVFAGGRRLFFRFDGLRPPRLLQKRTAVFPFPRKGAALMEIGRCGRRAESVRFSVFFAKERAEKPRLFPFFGKGKGGTVDNGRKARYNI